MTTPQDNTNKTPKPSKKQPELPVTPAQAAPEVDQDELEALRMFRALKAQGVVLTSENVQGLLLAAKEKQEAAEKAAAEEKRKQIAKVFFDESTVLRNCLNNAETCTMEALTAACNALVITAAKESTLAFCLLPSKPAEVAKAKPGRKAKVAVEPELDAEGNAIVAAPEEKVVLPEITAEEIAELDAFLISHKKVSAEFLKSPDIQTEIKYEHKGSLAGGRRFAKMLDTLLTVGKVEKTGERAGTKWRSTAGNAATPPAPIPPLL